MKRATWPFIKFNYVLMKESALGTKVMSQKNMTNVVWPGVKSGAYCTKFTRLKYWTPSVRHGGIYSIRTERIIKREVRSVVISTRINTRPTDITRWGNK